MNRRINKTRAEKAATTMANAAFNSKIELAQKRLSEVAETLVIKYIPNVVRVVVAEFPSYFERVKYISITAPRVYADGYEGHEDYICAEISFYIPKGSRYINVSDTEYKELKKLYMRYRVQVKEQHDLKAQIFDALCALKTENKVKENLPEALPFLEFPDEVHLPAPIFGTLRQIIKNIKTNDNGEEK